jgi:hypothetical protein
MPERHVYHDANFQVLKYRIKILSSPTCMLFGYCKKNRFIILNKHHRTFFKPWVKKIYIDIWLGILTMVFVVGCSLHPNNPRRPDHLLMYSIGQFQYKWLVNHLYNLNYVILTSNGHSTTIFTKKKNFEKIESLTIP